MVRLPSSTPVSSKAQAPLTAGLKTNWIVFGQFGDLDGDGFDDIGFGAPYAPSTDQGSAYLPMVIPIPMTLNTFPPSIWMPQ